MFYFFLISCFNPAQALVCTSTPVPSLAACHALIKATNDLGEERNAGGVTYYPAFRCLTIRA